MKIPRFVPGVGAFQPNTREARTLILLHELAHLIRGKDGRWLIPDDGGDPSQSRQSTVEAKCGTQIRAFAYPREAIASISVPLRRRRGRPMHGNDTSAKSSRIRGKRVVFVFQPFSF